MANYSIVDDAYGKTGVKLLHIKRDGPLHSIHELEISTHLTLASKKDYTEGDNSDIVATDSQKNTCYLLAKKYGVASPEEFAQILARHFLTTYKHVLKVRIAIEQYPWERAQADGKKHNHAFIFTPVAIRFCVVTQERNGAPMIESGIKDLRVLKTTQSSFTNFVNDEYRSYDSSSQSNVLIIILLCDEGSLPDAQDRVFSTVVACTWQYSTNNVNFCKAWETVKDAILDLFAGPPENGIYSPSVQHSLHLMEKRVLDSIPEVQRIEIVLPNKHYVNVDLSKYPRVGFVSNDEVLQPLDKPSGNIRAALTRNKQISSKL